MHILAQKNPCLSKAIILNENHNFSFSSGIYLQNIKTETNWADADSFAPFRQDIVAKNSEVKHAVPLALPPKMTFAVCICSTNRIKASHMHH